MFKVGEEIEVEGVRGIVNRVQKAPFGVRYLVLVAVGDQLKTRGLDEFVDGSPRLVWRSE